MAPSMQRGKQTARQFKVLELLENSRFGMTTREIRDEVVESLGLSSLHEKTIKRDLEHWRQLGYPIEQHETANPERPKIWVLDKTRRKIPRLPVGVVELLAFSAGRELLYPLAGTPYWDGIQRLWERMRDSTSPEVLAHLDRQRAGLIVRGRGPGNYAKKEGILSSLNRATFEHRLINIRYQGIGKNRARSRVIAPHAICLFDGSIYILAADVPSTSDQNPPEGPIKSFRLDRITAVSFLDRRFVPQSDFDPDAHFNNSIGIFRNNKLKNFRIQITRQFAELAVEILKHPRQRIRVQKDQSVVIEIEAAYEEEILPRVLSLGEHAEILLRQGHRKQYIQESLAAIEEAISPKHPEGKAVVLSCFTISA